MRELTHPCCFLPSCLLWRFHSSAPQLPHPCLSCTFLHARAPPFTIRCTALPPPCYLPAWDAWQAAAGAGAGGALQGDADICQLSLPGQLLHARAVEHCQQRLASRQVAPMPPAAAPPLPPHLPPPQTPGGHPPAAPRRPPLWDFTSPHGPEMGHRRAAGPCICCHPVSASACPNCGSLHAPGRPLLPPASPAPTNSRDVHPRRPGRRALCLRLGAGVLREPSPQPGAAQGVTCPGTVVGRRWRPGLRSACAAGGRLPPLAGSGGRVVLSGLAPPVVRLAGLAQARG